MALSRRQFLAAGAAAPFILAARPHRKYRTALIGSGWWGKNILNEAIQAGQSSVVALCDVDAGTLEAAADHVKGLSGESPKTYGDYRELLDKEKPEIVIIATPDHWHALTSIAALKAGAHVFVEKPTGHTVQESRAMLNTAKESGKVVQVGLHRRIGPHHVSAQKFLKEGGAGAIGMVRLFAHYGGGAEKPSPNAPPPDGLNWDLYCGPSALRPFCRKIHPGGWRQFLDFGNGQLGDWGVHWLDQVLMWTDEKFPKRIFSSGGRPVKGPAVLNEKEQTTDAPDHQVAVYEFESFTCTWEHRQFGDNQAEKHQIGAYFYGTKGTLHIGWRDGWTFYPSNGKEKMIHQDSQLQEPDGHNLKLLWADFLASLGGAQAPVASIERAHRSSVLPLLGMISLRTGRSIAWDGEKETIQGDPEASALLRRPYRAPWIYPG
ncbi:MAG TPA: Gfo/Idh/MocA family oxidoreductase [Planctomycetota bacterium]|nr:Gfo/Idh/MocA family oxidoreductase [Planctomycetota bacterium]